MTFKVGDKVRRTGPYRGGAVHGNEYVVAWVGATGYAIQLEGMGDYTYNADGFEKAFELPVAKPKDTYVAKRDQGKPQFDLLENGCPLAVLGLVQVLTWAVDVKEYKPHSWQTVPEAITRYSAAMRRHQNAKARGERYDPESGLLHDFHIMASATFIAELEARIDKAAGIEQKYHTAFPPVINQA